MLGAGTIGLFGGFVWGPKEEPWTGPVDSRNIGISGVGYGLSMDTRYVDRVIATPTGASIRSILSTILTEAGLTQFSLNGVLLSDTLDRVVYPYSSVSHILRDLATRVGAVVWVDPWREIQFRRRADVTRTDLVLDPTTVARISKKSTLRQFANRVVLIGAAQAGEAKDEFAGDGAKTVFDLTHQPTQLITVTVDGVPADLQLVANQQWTLSVPNHTVTATVAPPADAVPGKDNIVVEYATADSIVVTEDNLPSQQSFGIVTRKIEDATADTVDLARSKAQALLARHDSPAVTYPVQTIPGKVLEMVRPGTAPTLDLREKFPELATTRLLVERVETSLETSNPDKPAIVHRLTCTAQDYQSLFADYYHGLASAADQSGPGHHGRGRVSVRPAGSSGVGGACVASPARAWRLRWQRF